MMGRQRHQKAATLAGRHKKIKKMGRPALSAIDSNRQRNLKKRKRSQSDAVSEVSSKSASDSSSCMSGGRAAKKRRPTKLDRAAPPDDDEKMKQLREEPIKALQAIQQQETIKTFKAELRKKKVDLPMPMPFFENGEYLVIVDWDDTLMPSTLLRQHVHFTFDPQTRAISRFSLDMNLLNNPSLIQHFISDLDEAGAAALAFLQTTLSHFEDSSVKIVTNSEVCWVANSLNVTSTLCSESGVFSAIEALLAEHNIEVISARDA